MDFRLEFIIFMLLVILFNIGFLILEYRIHKRVKRIEMIHYIDKSLEFIKYLEEDNGK